MTRWLSWFIRPALAALRRQHPMTVDEAMRRFHTRHGGVEVQAAMLAYKLVTDKKGHLVDGPLRLVVVADNDIISADPWSGQLVGQRPTSDITGYFADVDGRLLVGFQQARNNFPAVAAMRPIALHGSPELSARKAGSVFIRGLIDDWEARTGRTFVNGWTGAKHARQFDAW